MLNQVQHSDLSLSKEPARSLNILVLDDSEVDRRRLIRLCEDAGLHFNAEEAATISEFRVALSSKAFDIVFIDYLLVDEDGLDAVRILVNEPNHNAVGIMIAGEGRMDIAIEAMRLGCSDYLTKSEVSVDALRKSVATALERQMMDASLSEERERRLKLEKAIRHYANTSSIEMRTILSGTLRRVRKLREHKVSEAYSVQLRELENSIDKLFDALPEFKDNTFLEIADVKSLEAPSLIRKH